MKHNPEGAERFERVFGGHQPRSAGGAGPGDPPTGGAGAMDGRGAADPIDKMGPLWASAAHVYSAVYVAAMSRHGGQPAARDEALKAAGEFYDLVCGFAAGGPA